MNKNSFNFKNRRLKKYYKNVKEINKKKEIYLEFSDSEIKKEFNNLKLKYKSNSVKNNSLDCSVLAILGVVFKRILNIDLFECQYIGALVMRDGDLAELKTGEGKTYVAVLCSVLNLMDNDNVHIVTANSYLAKRDYYETKVIFDYLGISSGYINETMSEDEKRDSYSKLITYVHSQELAFDYLRNNILFSKEKVYLDTNSFSSVIIDEIDYVLIDEAKTPIVLSTPSEELEDENIYKNVNNFILKIKNNEDLYDINLEKNIATLSDKGIELAEEFFNVENYSDTKFIETRHIIHQSLQAHFMIRKNENYIVQDNKIILIDESTGRLANDKTYTEGLHQAIQAKEQLEISPQSKTLGQITYPNLFKLYNKMTGMSGTIKTEEIEFKKNYGKDVICIPTNKPIRRVDCVDYIYATKTQKINAILEDIVSCYKKGQPVLVGTDSISTSEEISRRLIELKVPHNVLNAKNHEKESEIIALAGQKNAVTISTNMAGRGTDIKLDEDVVALGGLKIIGTYKNDNRRIDNQLRGRSGRQGDVGVSQFYVSLEDELIKGFAPLELKKLIEKYQSSETYDRDSLLKLPILVKQIERAQIKKESRNFESRIYNSQFDDILNKQREIIYNERNEILKCEDINTLIKDIIPETTRILVDNYMSCESDNLTKEDISMFKESINKDWDYKLELDEKPMTMKELYENIQNIIEIFYKDCNHKIYKYDCDEYKRMCLLYSTDKFWMKHLSDLKNLQLLIKFKENPLEEFLETSIELFNMAIENIKVYTVILYLKNLELSKKEFDINEEE